jgi:outer membrane protein assembly factor BamB
MKTSLRLSVAVAAMMALSACGIFKGGKAKTPVLGDRVPILASESSALADPSISAIEVVLPPATVNAEWSQPGGNAAKSMGQLELGASPTRVWTAQIAGSTQRARLAAAPIIAGGKLYVVDVNATVHSFDAATGARGWSTEISPGEENQQSRFGGGVSFEDGKLYASSGLGDVVAINAADGAILWRKKPGGPLRGAPTIANGNAYVLSQDNQLFALLLTDGSVQWNQSGSLETQGVFGVAAPASAQGTVVAGFSSGELNAYRYENGRQLWQDSLSRSSASTSVSSLADIDAAPVIDQGRAYAVGQGGRMVALELATGQRLWEQNFAGISTPWIAGEWLFLVTDDARLICIGRSNGKIRWISQLKHWDNEKKRKGLVSWTGPVLAGNRLILLNSDGEMAFASPTDGSVTSTMEAGKGFDLPPVVANSMLYTIDDEGRISAYR